jgi:hypothetical protein
VHGEPKKYRTIQKNKKCRTIQKNKKRRNAVGVARALTHARTIARAFLWNVSVFSFELEMALHTLRDIFFVLSSVADFPATFFHFHFDEATIHAVSILEDMKFLPQKIHAVGILEDSKFLPQQIHAVGILEDSKFLPRHISWDDGPVSI